MKQLLPDTGAEVAFAGRSNSGKSSALNALTGHKRLAITSKTPGRTQQIVMFSVNENIRLADLPGYGYAKVPDAMRKHWAKTIEKYFATRESLCGLAITMDIRHPLKSMDKQLIEWCCASSVHVHILLTKADKLSSSRVKNTVALVCKELGDFQQFSTVQAFSSTNGMGVTQARSQLLEWVNAASVDLQS